MTALATTDLQGALPLIARGKVRDLYQLPNDALLFVATDRISAYDVVMENGVPNKGKLLTALSEFWFSHLATKCPNHLISTSLDSLPVAVTPYKSQLEGRSMVVRKLKIFPVEAIVRGYITGSAWSEYKKQGTVHGIKVKEGLRESEAFEKPLFTPSTKAEQGEHDENIHPDKMVELVGEKYAKRIEQLAVELYTAARDYAIQRGIIIADTKFEFGLDEETDEVVLVDEVLTPDSSRFWPADKYEVGKGQESYDKQFLRDWLTSNGLKGKEGVKMPEEIATKTAEKYTEAYELLTGKKLAF
ncbi:SAICAR synthetase [Ascodesmis nigricans]|uniref:Phosphoribosylaminoimidazole-succinocarboxamide synthase n=1 Tax=Ascodesmis nigricans TaxID=341454 RepID=A0A4S2N278_9PEZI|nr:SAICAR synthetase [Ascodesmis nigricans]